MLTADFVPREPVSGGLCEDDLCPRTHLCASRAGRRSISRRAADRLRAGHVWVYRSDIEHLVEMDAGLIAVADHRGFPLGTALWSPTSQIALRLLTSDPHLTHPAWMALFDQRLRQAIQLRAGMLDEGTDACRLVFSEADQLPGLIVDRYGDLILFEILAKALDRDDIRARSFMFCNRNSRRSRSWNGPMPASGNWSS